VRVEVRLYATFARYAPTQHAGEPFSADIADSASLTDLIRKLSIPGQEVHLAIVNGRVIHNHSFGLSEADRIGLFPPVGGG